MPPITKQRLWLTFFSSLVIAVLLCTGFYYLALRAGLSVQGAGFLAGATFITSIAALIYSLMRTLRDPTWQPVIPTIGPKTLFWLGAVVVVPILTSILHLASGMLVVILLATIEATGLPVAKIADSVSWFAVLISFVCAAWAWWIIWKRYTAPVAK